MRSFVTKVALPVFVRWFSPECPVPPNVHPGAVRRGEEAELGRDQHEGRLEARLRLRLIGRRARRWPRGRRDVPLSANPCGTRVARDGKRARFGHAKVSSCVPARRARPVAPRTHPKGRPVSKLEISPSRRMLVLVPALLSLGGCVMQSTYNSMLAQQKAIESALRSEVAADQVEIRQLQDGIQVRMSSDLLYGSGSIELTPAGRAALDKVAPQLAQSAAQSFQVDITGNTDNVPIGPELISRFPTNWELAGARAAVVVRYLQERGVDPRKLEAVSNGQYHPVASNDSPEGRARNRRTDVVLRPETPPQ